jgi:hypothetical protein
MALRDDEWLWNIIRGSTEGAEEGYIRYARDAVLYRDKSAMRLLWKDRTGYYKWHKELAEKSRLRKGEIDVRVQKRGRDYEAYLSAKLGIRSSVFWLKFDPLGTETILCGDDKTGSIKDIYELSEMLTCLKNVWDNELHYYIILFGDSKEGIDDICNKWVNITRDWCIT